MATIVPPIPPTPIRESFEWRDWFNSLKNALTTVSNNVSSNGSGVTPTPTPAVVGKKIVVIGDSLSAQNVLFHNSWPTILEQNMRASDAPCTVYNLAVDGHTCYRANTVVKFGANTAVVEAISLAPDIVIVMLGFNDAITAVDGRNLTQIKADALTMFTTLRAGLPNAKILYASELAYDSVNFTVTASTCNAVTKGVVPYLFQFLPSGVNAGNFCTEMLGTAMSSAKKTLLETWFSFDVYVKALSQIDASFTMNYWRIARLGCVLPDGLHLNFVGSMLEAGYIQKGIANLSFVSTLFPKLVNQNYPVWNDPDTLFTTTLGASGSGWTYTPTGIAEYFVIQAGERFQLYPFDDSWFLPYHTRFTLAPLGSDQTTTAVTNDSNSYFSWTCLNGPPLAQINIAIDGAGSYTGLGNYTNGEGFGQGVGTGLSTTLSTGSHTIRYSISSQLGPIEAYGPYTFVINAAVPLTIGTGGTGSTTGQGLTYFAKAIGVGGSANAVTITTDIAPPSLVWGDSIIFVPKSSNTTDTTVAVNGGSALHVFNGSSLLSGGEFSTAAGVRLTLNEALTGWGMEIINNGTSIAIPVSIANGGTNSTTSLSGSTIMVSDGTHIVQGGAGSAHLVLHGNASGVPTYSAVDLTADVTGVLPVANGGTGSNTGGLAASTQITSSLATGTAPIAVTSTTQCTNLNAAAVNGVSFPGATTGTAVGTLILTGKPGTNQNSVWGALTTGGVTYDFPLFPR